MAVTSTFPTSADTFAFYNNQGNLDDLPTHGDRHDHLASAVAAIEAYLLTGGTTGFEVVAHKGVANGYASLDATGNVPAAQLGNAAVTLTSTATDSQALGTQAAGTSPKAAHADHVHPLTGVLTTGQRGAVNGVASLDATGNVPAAQLANASGTVTLDAVATDIQPLGTQAAGTNTKAPHADHVHPTTGLVTTAMVGGINGVAALDGNRLVPGAQLPAVATTVLYTGTAWPARPSSAVWPAGFVKYVSATGGVSAPADALPGDQVFIPNVTAAPVFTADTPPGGTISVAYSYQYAATNSPTAYAVASGALPTGVTLNTTTGLLSGTPTAAGTYNFTISAANAAGTTTTPSQQIIIAAGGTTITPANSPASNWTDLDGCTVTNPGTPQHGGTNPLALTKNATAQSYMLVGQVFSATAGTSYSLAAVFVEATAANRKAYVTFTFLDGSFNPIAGGAFTGSSVNLTSGSYVTGPTLTGVTAPTGAQHVTVTITVQDTGGANIPTSELAYISFT